MNYSENTENDMRKVYSANFPHKGHTLLLNALKVQRCFLVCYGSTRNQQSFDPHLKTLNNMEIAWLRITFRKLAYRDLGNEAEYDTDNMFSVARERISVRSTLSKYCMYTAKESLKTL